MRSSSPLRETPDAVRFCLLVCVLLTAGLTCTEVLRHPGFLVLEGAPTGLAWAMGPLALYAGVLVWPALRRPRVSMAAGAAGAGIQVVHLVVERFAAIAEPWRGVVTLGFMLATFLCWSWAAFRARRDGAHLGGACWAAAWSAMVTMTVAVLWGTIFEWFIAPVSPESMRGWAEFQRTGWSDPGAFAIANVLDSIASHLSLAPVVAVLFGAMGFVVGRPALTEPA